MPAAPATPVLELRGVSHPPALHTVDLAVWPGELVAVLGEPGSGKSALLDLASGAATPATGRVLIDGHDQPTHPGVIRIPQRDDRALDPRLTAAQNIALPHELAGATAGAARQRALTLLLEMELAEIADRLPGELSRPERRAVIVARGLGGEHHRLVLADEPAAGLDVELADTLLVLLRQRRAAGAAVLLATRDPEHAAWADRVVLLHDGVTFDPSPAARPADASAAAPPLTAGKNP